jgi:acyl-CoA thioester hydrolase
MILKRIVETELKETVRVKIRFSEIDSMGVLWHGNYIHFFEDAREAFGIKYGIPYLDDYHNGYYTPIVSINCEYKSPLKYGDEALVEITYFDTPAAKIIFKYNIRNAVTNTLVATGDTVQVFLSTANNCLSISNPAFFDEWKQRMGLNRQY